MSATSALDRLDPRDFYRRLDRLRDEWLDGTQYETEPDSPEARYADTRRQAALELHVREIARRIRDLERLAEHLPPRFYEPAQKQIDQLERAQIVRTVDWLGAINALSRTISEWDRSRPPLVACPECTLEVRGQRALRLHLLTVHQIEDA